MQSETVSPEVVARVMTSYQSFYGWLDLCSVSIRPQEQTAYKDKPWPKADCMYIEGLSSAGGIVPTTRDELMRILSGN